MGFLLVFFKYRYMSNGISAVVTISLVPTCTFYPLSTTAFDKLPQDIWILVWLEVTKWQNLAGSRPFLGIGSLC